MNQSASNNIPHGRSPSSGVSLTAIPAELFLLILDHLPDSDLSSLRLTCREVNGRVAGRYRKAFFTTKQFMLSRFSIQTLLEISCNEAIRPYLKTVLFGTDVLKCLPEELSQEFYLHRTLTEDQRDAEDNAVGILTRALANLPSCNAIEVRDYGSEAGGMDSYGRSTTAQLLQAPIKGLEWGYAHEKELTQAVKIVLLAVKASGIVLRHFGTRVRVWRKQWDTMYYRFMVLSPDMLLDLQHGLSHLQSLRLNLTAHGIPEAPGSNFFQSACTFDTLAQSSTNLEELHLNFGGLSPTYRWSVQILPCLSSLKFLELRSVMFGPCSGDESGGLVRIFQALRHSLQTLVLAGVDLEGKWRPAFDALCETSLKSIRLVDLTERGLSLVFKLADGEAGAPGEWELVRIPPSFTSMLLLQDPRIFSPALGSTGRLFTSLPPQDRELGNWTFTASSTGGDVSSFISWLVTHYAVIGLLSIYQGNELSTFHPSLCANPIHAAPVWEEEVG